MLVFEEFSGAQDRSESQPQFLGFRCNVPFVSAHQPRNYQGVKSFRIGHARSRVGKKVAILQFRFVDQKGNIRRASDTGREAYISIFAGDAVAYGIAVDGKRICASAESQV